MTLKEKIYMRWKVLVKFLLTSNNFGRVIELEIDMCARVLLKSSHPQSSQQSTAIYWINVHVTVFGIHHRLESCVSSLWLKYLAWLQFYAMMCFENYAIYSESNEVIYIQNERLHTVCP